MRLKLIAALNRRSIAERTRAGEIPTARDVARTIERREKAALLATARTVRA